MKITVSIIVNDEELVIGTFTDMLFFNLFMQALYERDEANEIDMRYIVDFETEE